MVREVEDVPGARSFDQPSRTPVQRASLRVVEALECPLPHHVVDERESVSRLGGPDQAGPSGLLHHRVDVRPRSTSASAALSSTDACRPNTAAAERNPRVSSVSRWSRRVTRVVACRDEVSVASASRSISHPCGPGRSAADSTIPRRTDVTKNGRPWESCATTACAMSGIRPPIDDARSLVSSTVNGGRTMVVASAHFPPRDPRTPPPVRSAVTTLTNLSVGDVSADHDSTTPSDSPSAHWQSSSRSSAGRCGVPRASKSTASASRSRRSDAGDRPSPESGVSSRPRDGRAVRSSQDHGPSERTRWSA